MQDDPVCLFSRHIVTALLTEVSPNTNGESQVSDCGLAALWEIIQFTENGFKYYLHSCFSKPFNSHLTFLLHF